MTEQINAFEVPSDSSTAIPLTIERRTPGPMNVSIGIGYCGIFHCDIHVAHNDWNINRPHTLVPGHEIVGRAPSKGKDVLQKEVGDRVAFGCMARVG